MYYSDAEEQLCCSISCKEKERALKVVAYCVHSYALALRDKFGA